MAAAAVAAGATLVNDVGGALGPVAADLGVGWVAMHMQGTPQDMQHDPRYDDVVAEVHGAVLARARDAPAAGVSEVWVDPGIGFGKTAGAQPGAAGPSVGPGRRGAATLGARVLVGTSRKSFLGRFGTEPGRSPVPVDDRLEASLATAVWALARARHGARPRRGPDRPGGPAGRPPAVRDHGVAGRWQPGHGAGSGGA